AESATLLDGRSDERDQPFIFGATNVELPSFKAAFLAILRRFHGLGIEELSGHELYAMSDEECSAAGEWIDRVGLATLIDAAAARDDKGGRAATDTILDRVFDRFVDLWQA